MIKHLKRPAFITSNERLIINQNDSNHKNPNGECTCIKSTRENTFSLSTSRGGMNNVQPVRIALRNSCRWSIKPTDVLNNRSSSPCREYKSCIHQNRFKRPTFEIEKKKKFEILILNLRYTEEQK